MLSDMKKPRPQSFLPSSCTSFSSFPSAIKSTFVEAFERTTEIKGFFFVRNGFQSFNSSFVFCNDFVENTSAANLYFIIDSHIYQISRAS